MRPHAEQESILGHFLTLFAGRGIFVGLFSRPSFEGDDYKGRQLFTGEKCTRDKLLATPRNNSDNFSDYSVAFIRR